MRLLRARGVLRQGVPKAHWPDHEAARSEATEARVFAGEGELHMGAEQRLKHAMEKAWLELGAEHKETPRGGPAKCGT